MVDTKFKFYMNCDLRQDAFIICVFIFILSSFDLDMQWTVTIQKTYEGVIKWSLKSSLIKIQLHVLVYVHFEPMAKLRKLNWNMRT